VELLMRQIQSQDALYDLRKAAFDALKDFLAIRHIELELSEFLKLRLRRFFTRFLEEMDELDNVSEKQGKFCLVGVFSLSHALGAMSFGVEEMEVCMGLLEALWNKEKDKTLRRELVLCLLKFDVLR
jgi:hypothetical protein